jgi:hypothetical protein
MPDEQAPKKKTDPNQCAPMLAGNVIATQSAATVLEYSESRRVHLVPNCSDTDTNGTITACGGGSVIPTFAQSPIIHIASESIYTGGEPTKATSQSYARSSES